MAERKGPPIVTIAKCLQYGDGDSATRLYIHKHDATVYHSMDEGDHGILSLLLHHRWSAASDQKAGIS